MDNLVLTLGNFSPLCVNFYSVTLSNYSNNGGEFLWNASIWESIGLMTITMSMSPMTAPCGWTVSLSPIPSPAWRNSRGTWLPSRNIQGYLHTDAGVAPGSVARAGWYTPVGNAISISRMLFRIWCGKVQRDALGPGIVSSDKYWQK